ncbi:hypothetical protein IWZ01DRAFT_314395 [Phyllosticta capitalensis]
MTRSPADFAKSHGTQPLECSVYAFLCDTPTPCPYISTKLERVVLSSYSPSPFARLSLRVPRLFATGKTPPPRTRAGHYLSIICACGTLETMSDHNLASALARSLDDRSRQEQRRPNEHAWGGAALHAPSGGRRLMRCVVEQSINCATCLRALLLAGWHAGSLGPTNIASGRVRPIRPIHPLFGQPANTKTAVAVLLPPFDHPFIIIADLPTCE